jgi:15-cis-phytoene synthase
MTATIDARMAYAHCERVTREQAANFYYGIRLLPRPKRAALSAAYAFARRVDDIGDGTEPQAQKRRELESARRDLEALSTPSDDPVLVALADAVDRYHVPVDALAELIDGVEMDVDGVTYETFDDLLVYCRRVAGTVGRISVAVFESRDEEQAIPLADALGVALQITNILRDIREDRELGRRYVPWCDIEQWGVAPDLSGPPEAFAGLVRFEAARAQEWYSRGFELLPLLDRRSRACVAAMAGIYWRLLARIEHSPELVLETRVSLSSREKAWVAVRGLALTKP